MSAIRINDNQRLYTGGPTGAPKANFRMQMDRMIRDYQLNHPRVHHITNHPKAPPQRHSYPIVPHLPPAGNLNPEWRQPDPRRSSQTVNWMRMSGMIK